MGIVLTKRKERWTDGRGGSRRTGNQRSTLANCSLCQTVSNFSFRPAYVWTCNLLPGRPFVLHLRCGCGRSTQRKNLTVLVVATKVSHEFTVLIRLQPITHQLFDCLIGRVTTVADQICCHAGIGASLTGGAVDEQWSARRGCQNIGDFVVLVVRSNA